jgi:hypothetical protein
MARVLRRASTVALARAGATQVWRQGRGAVVTVWAVVGLVSAATVLPAWSWWARDTARAIEARRGLGSLTFGLISELDRANPAGFDIIVDAAKGGALVALLLLNPFLAGGLLGRLSRAAPDEGQIARFAADGLRHYLPLLRSLVLVAVPAGLAGTVAATLAWLGAYAAGTPEAAGLAIALGALIGVIGLATILLDLTRISLVRGRTRSALKALGWAVWFAAPRLPRLAGLALLAGAFVVLAGAVLVTGLSWLAGAGWPAILAGLALQQAHALGRTWVRATWIASELALVDAEGPGAAVGLPPPPPGPTTGPMSAAAEQRPEVLVVVEREAGEPGQTGDEGVGRGDLPPEVSGRLAAEGDGGRGDGDAGEAGPAGAAGAGDRQRPEPPPVA